MIQKPAVFVSPTLCIRKARQTIDLHGVVDVVVVVHIVVHVVVGVPDHGDVVVVDGHGVVLVVVVIVHFLAFDDFVVHVDHRVVISRRLTV